MNKSSVRTVVAGALGGLLLSTFGAAPAHAAVVLHGCDERVSYSGLGVLCLFNGTEYGKGDWRQYDLQYIASRPGGCVTLPANFRNVASSFAYNPTFSGQAAFNLRRLRFWNGNSCTGGATSWPADVERADNDLRTTVNYGNISNWANAVNIS